MSTPASPAASAPQPLPQSSLSEPARIMNTFTAPAKTFSDIRGNGGWWVPLVLMSIFTIAFWVTLDQKVGFDQIAHNVMANSSQFQQQSAEQQARTLTFVTATMKYSGYASPLFILIYALIIAAVLMATFNFGLEAEVPFSRALAIVIYGWLPSLVGSVLAIITVSLGNPEGFRLENPVGTNPAYFLDFASTSKFLYQLVASLDVINLWIVALIGMGFALNAKKKISTGTAIFTVAAWYFAWKLVSAGWAAMRA